MAAHFQLSPIAAQAGYRLEAFSEVGSTNAVALQRAAAGDPGRLWIVTDHQTNGRGRRGRRWEGSRGNLAASLLLRPPVDLAVSASLGFVAALALGEALEAVVSGPTLAIAPDGGSAQGGGRWALKWPNDVLVGGAKLAGILLETVALGQQSFAVAIGIGVNVVDHPENAPFPATDLTALGGRCDASRLFLALSDAWTSNVQLWQDGRGLDAIRSKWLKHAAGLGSEVAVRLDNRIVRGTFETIDADCRFVIREDNGRRTTVTAGDVHFGAVASAHAD
ncbi:biotin--[acetyl-CoA-carboxylase] ligase [Consotaella aegiceratis]|uniref:biotin--[acetyl-CoA-carboxylase] ligase n=1 Tax=Consotaella aegiceratis TaxID=3097961 RepID=UPI002F42F214